MRKMLLVSLVLAMLFAAAAPVLASPGQSGFKLTGTDAAYADFQQGDCTVFVGYVWAKKLKFYDTGDVFRPHSDLEVKVSGSCGELVGVVPTVDDPRAEIVELTSASVDEITVPLAPGIDAVVDLAWTAYGDEFSEQIREPGERAHHRTRRADVTGTVTITGLGVFAPDDLLDGARITHYNERSWTP